MSDLESIAQLMQEKIKRIEAINEQMVDALETLVSKYQYLNEDKASKAHKQPLAACKQSPAIAKASESYPITSLLLLS